MTRRVTAEARSKPAGTDVRLYIRPCYANAWDWAELEAEENEMSLSEFVSRELSRAADRLAKAEMEYRGE